MQELRDRTGVCPAQFGVRLQRQPRSQHERTLPGTRVRQRQIGVVAAHAVEIDDVEVERARCPMVRSHAPMFGFDALQTAQQFLRGEFRVHRHDRIEEFRGARRHAPRVGAVQRRDARHLRGRQPVDAAHRVTQRGGDVSLIAAQRDDGVMHRPRNVRSIGRIIVTGTADDALISTVSGIAEILIIGAVAGTVAASFAADTGTGTIRILCTRLRLPRNGFTGTFHGDAHIVERYDDRRVRLVHGHLHARHGGIAENHRRDAIG